MSWVYNTPSGTPTDGPTLAGVGLAMTGLALITVLLRLYVRLLLIKAVGWDDLLIILSWIGAAGYTTCTVIQTKWGLGLKVLDDMPLENLYNFGLVQYIGAPFYVVGIWGFKTSLLFAYMRFIPQGAYHVAAIVVAVAVTMGHIAFFCVFLFMCTPISKQWDPEVTYGHCADQVSFYLTFSSLTIVFDVIVLLLPFPVLVRSKIQKRRKAVLLCLFALGIFVTVIQSIRIQTIKNLSNYLDSADSILWSIVENDIGIIICNIPTLAPLVKYFSERSRTGTGSRPPDAPDSRYVLQSWKGSRGGMRPLGSVTDRDAAGSHGPDSVADDGSQEHILEQPGIVKTTDVIVTRQDAPRAHGDVESAAESGLGQRRHSRISRDS